MNFGAAKFFGATDKRFQDKYNYLVDLMSKYSSELFNNIYPVGSVYISVVPTNPSTLFGGTWAVFGAGRTLVGIDSTDTDFDTAEETRGEKTVTLDTTMIPAHKHQTPILTYSGDKPAVAGADANYDTAALMQNGTSGGIDTLNTGGGLAHNNIQPSIIVYMWKRTA